MFAKLVSAVMTSFLRYFITSNQIWGPESDF